MYTVYKRILPDGRCYIGCTSKRVTMRAGNNGECYAVNPRFHKAIQEVGWDSVQTVTLQTCETVEDASLAEKEEIQKFLQKHDRDLLLNVIINSRYSQTASVNNARRNSIKSYWTPELRAQHSIKMKGKLSSNSIRKKLSDAGKRRYSNPEERLHTQVAAKKAWTDEKRKAQSTLIREKLQDPEIRKKISENTKLGQSKPGSHERRVEAQLRKWKDPEFRARRANSLAAAMSKPEYLEALSKRVREHHASPEYRNQVSKQFKGTVFIHKADVGKRVPAEDVPLWESQGWTRGRRPRKS